MLDLVRRHNNFVILLKNMKTNSSLFYELVSFKTHKFSLVFPFSLPLNLKFKRNHATIFCGTKLIRSSAHEIMSGRNRSKNEFFEGAEWKERSTEFTSQYVEVL